MPRPRTVPDPVIFARIRRLLAEQGEKAVAFGSVSRMTGLAAPTLVQRYESLAGMVSAALMAGWQDLQTATSAADAAEPEPQALLKVLTKAAEQMSDPALMAITLRDAALRDAATHWRQSVEAALARRLGGGAKGREAAAILFAAWQGQLGWLGAGGKGFRLKESVKRIT